MTNYKIKSIIIESGLKQFQVAEKLGYSETTFSRKIRKGLTDAELKKVLSIIKEMKGSVNDGKN